MPLKQDDGPSEASRSYGLDVFRSIAVLAVLAGHTLQHSVVPEWLAAAGRVGSLGVEMFFVLSGFLIGRILIQLLDKGQMRRWRDVREFWSRRWLRTLPMYFLALVAFLRFDYMGRHALSDYPLYWVFMQNFAWPIPVFFGLSWSLTIEEHFYLCFPLLLLGLARVVRSPKQVLFAAIGILWAAVLVYRGTLPFFPDFDSFNYGSRMVVLAHLDGIAAGVLVVAIKRWHPRMYALLIQFQPLWWLGIAAMLAWYFIGLPGLTSSRFLQWSLVSIQALLLAFAIPWFQARESSGYAPIDRFVRMTSLQSYSMYLLHILVIVFVNKGLAAYGLYDTIYPNATLLYPIYFAGYYGLSWLTFRAIERPFMALRDGPFSWRGTVQAAWPLMGVVLAIAVFA